jgi:glycosyltransferase involved in cell wall biosynthesis
MRRLLTHSATGGFAVSSQSGDSLFPNGWANSKRWKLAYLGTDLSRFSGPVDRTTIRPQLGLDKASLVIGHVGSMGYENQKNQDFIIKVAMELLRTEPDAMFLLVGQGPRFSTIKQAIADRGLSDHFVLAGQRPDVPLLLRGAMDIFLFPSVWEGLPIVLLEAQAAGLRCLISDSITREADVVEELITRESLQEPVSQWALSIARIAHLPRLTSEVACSRMQPRSIRTSCEELIAAYEGFALNVN